MIVKYFSSIVSNNQLTVPLIPPSEPPKSVSLSVFDVTRSDNDVTAPRQRLTPQDGGVTVAGGRSYRVECEAQGSRPAASLLWLLDSAPLSSSAAFNFTERSEGFTGGQHGTDSRSALTIRPGRHDADVHLTCRAYNPALNASISHTLTIAFQCECRRWLKV